MPTMTLTDDQLELLTDIIGDLAAGQDVYVPKTPNIRAELEDIYDAMR